MFGRKERIHSQAYGFMVEWKAIFDAVTQNISFGMTEKEIEEINEDKLMGILSEFMMALLGVLGYMVAGLNHADAAQEMLEIFKKNFASYPDEMNPNNLTPDEAAQRVNGFYQNATQASEQLMSEGKGFGEIVKAHAEGMFKWIGIKAFDEDISFVENCLRVFYKDAYEKYYGIEPDFISNRETNANDNYMSDDASEPKRNGSSDKNVVPKDSTCDMQPLYGDDNLQISDNIEMTEQPKIYTYSISKVLKAGEFKSTDYQRVLFCLKQSNKYKNRLSDHFTGTYVRGNMEEILAEIQFQMNKQAEDKIDEINEKRNYGLINKYDGNLVLEESEAENVQNAEEHGLIPETALRALKSLYDDGIITDDEYSEKKRKLLKL